MINLLKRFWAYLLGKGHAGMDLAENKIEKANLRIIEMKSQQGTLLESLASVKAVSIRHYSDSKDYSEQSKSYLEKAEVLKEKYIAEEDEDKKTELRGFITLALNKAENLKLESEKFKEMGDAQEANVKVLQEKTKKFMDAIKDSESRLKVAKAQQKAADANKRVSKELSSFNFDGITSQLDNIDEDILTDNIEAESWSKLDNDLKSDETKMNELLSKESPTNNDKMFEDFMKPKA